MSNYPLLYIVVPANRWSERIGPYESWQKAHSIAENLRKGGMIVRVLVLRVDEIETVCLLKELAASGSKLMEYHSYNTGDVTYDAVVREFYGVLEKVHEALGPKGKG